MLFRDEDREKDEKGPFWYSSFIRNFEAEQARENKENDLLGAKDYGKILERENQKKEEIRKSKENDLPHYDPKEKKYEFRDYYDQKQIFSDSIYDKYLVAEEHAMSEGKNAFENTVKGMFNRLRSAPGEAIEDAAYFLKDNIRDDAPGKGMRWLDDNAEKVVEKNMAGSIGDISTFQFGKAIENGADENLVKIMDEVSKELGYNIFGLKLGNYIEPLGEGFNVYRDLREQGYSKDEAAEKTILTLVYSFVLEMLFDKGEKLLLNRFKIKNGRGTNGIVAKADDILPGFPKKSTIKLDIQFFAEKDLINQSSASLKKGIKSLKKEIEIHEAKLNNPENFDIGWNNKDNRAKEGLLKYWQKEIRNQKESIENRIEELRKRGEDYD